MKLYRGLKTSEWIEFSRDIETEINKTWEQLLTLRSKGQFSYPVSIDANIKRTEKLIRLRQQYFTDHRDIALSYAKSSGGALVEIEVPQNIIIKNFKIEFQNFSKRRKNFELVYLVDSTVLRKNQKEWKLKVTRFSTAQT